MIDSNPAFQQLCKHRSIAGDSVQMQKAGFSTATMVLDHTRAVRSPCT